MRLTFRRGIKFVLVVTLYLGTAGICYAKNDSRRPANYVDPSKHSGPDFSLNGKRQRFMILNGMDFSIIHPVRSSTITNSDDIAEMIPLDMSPSNNTGSVASQIFDRSISNFFQRPEVKNSDIGRSAASVEKAMDKQISIGGEEDDSVKHTFRMKMQAAQTKAMLDYTGYVNAQLSYQIVKDRFNLEMYRELKKDTKIVYGHSTGRDQDQRDIVSVRWNW